MELLPSVGTCLLSCPFIIGCPPICVSLLHSPDGIFFNLHLNMLFALKFMSQDLPLGKPNLGKKKIQGRGEKPSQKHRLCYVTQAAVTKYHRLCGLNSKNRLCRSSGGYKSAFKVSVGLVPPEASLPGMQTSPCVFTLPSVYTCLSLGPNFPIS